MKTKRAAQPALRKLKTSLTWSDAQGSELAAIAERMGVRVPTVVRMAVKRFLLDAKREE